MLDFIKTCIATIKHAPICDLHKRQQRLIELLVHIVNHETLDGALTAQAGNKALESMDYWRSLNEYLRDAGFERLGNGHFSAAYKHAALPGKVFKVGFKKEDSGAAYVAFCRMHQGLPGIPVIHDVQRHAGCYTVIMDELISLDEADVAEAEDMHQCAEFGVEGVKWDTEMENMYLAEDKAIYETGKKIREFFKGIGRFDMHRGNTMWCPKRETLFITDPVSFSLDAKGDRKFGQDDWVLDVAAIEEERKEMQRVQLVERCKKRWARNNLRISGLQSRACKARRKAVKKRQKEPKMDGVMRMDRQLVHRLANMQIDPDHMANMFCKNNWGRIDEVMKANAERFRIDNRGRIYAGLPLACDVELDKRFLG